MYLKTIEFYGFKSFAEKTTLNFDRQMTAVVGPNGCGKSNIIDAMKWCLGEQSAHSLRSPQMLGVVFNGSQKRAGLNFAEVSLTFDNESKLLPLDYTEVTITRKLFRSGESEYYINKTQCRLKDVRDVFLDTGIGKEGYSIFEQGKVEFITNAKPEERMLLFEEAAGISKYKVRREETLHKLEKVHKDMDVVNNIISVLKEQITALESAVRKANLYKKYQEDLKVLVAADVTQKMNSLDNELAPLAGQLEKANNEVIEKTTSIDKLEGEIANLQVEKTNFDKNLNDIYMKLSQLNKDIAQCEERIRTSQERINESTERRSTVEFNIKDFDQIKKSLEENLAAIAAELKNHQESVNECRANYENKKNDFETLKRNMFEKQAQVAKLNNQIIENMSAKSSMNNEIVRLNSEMDNITSRVASQNLELSKITLEESQVKEILERLTAEINNFKQKLTLVLEEYEEATAKLNISLTDIEAAESAQKELENRFYTLSSRLATINEMSHKEINVNTIYSIMDKNFPGIHGTVKNLLNVSEFHAKLVANYLGEKMNYLVCDSMANAQVVIEHLETNKLGWAGFILLDSIPELHEKDFVGELRGERPLSSVVNSEQRWERLVKFLFHNTQFYGNTVLQEAVICGGSLDSSKPAGFEISAIEKEIAGARASLTASEGKLKIQKQESAQLAEIQKQKDGQLKELNFTLANLQKDFKVRCDRLELCTVEYETVKNQITILDGNKEACRGKIPGIQAAIDKIGQENESSKTEIAALEAEITELVKLESEVGSELTELAKELSGREERYNSYQRENATTEANLKMQQDHFAQAENEIKNLTERIAEQQEIFRVESGRIDGLHEQRAALDEEISKLQLQSNEIYKIIEEKQVVLNEMKEAFANLQQESRDLEIKFKTKEIERSNLAKQLEELSIGYEEAKKNYLSVEVNQEQIIKLKRRVESVGPVNMAAQEQYTDLEKRYTFLINQQQDLLKAEQDLRQAISKINSSIKEGFYATFQQVRENFYKVYKQLFEGGEADILVVNNEDNVANGIEIVAQPPGKKLQSLSLLSGGEKALTAIALLFAFYMVRPSPICLLDEVDAPLDDANVTRFLNLLKFLGANTQFLMITHNKRSMEAADVLYGVTMEEYGVSKIISMRLQKQQGEEEETKAEAPVEELATVS